MSAENFRKEFMNVICDKERKIYKFGKEHFILKGYNIEEEIRVFNLKLDFLESLTFREKRIVKAKLEEIKDSSDISKTLPITMGIITLLLTFAGLVIGFALNEKLYGFFIVLIGIAFLMILSAVRLYQGIKNRKIAVYLNALLEKTLNSN